MTLYKSTQRNKFVLLLLAGVFLSSSPSYALQAGVTEKTREQSKPPYDQVKPQWALELAYSQNTFTKSPTIANSTASIQSGSILFEYQPSFIQRFGVLGLGVMVSLYNVSPSGVLTQSLLSFYSGGGQVRYQARYFHEQPVVPYIGYGLEYFQYQFIDASQKSFLRSGPIVGLMVYINALDSRSARDLFSSSGIARTYFLAEARGSSSGDQTLTLSPLTWFFGIRIEF